MNYSFLLTFAALLLVTSPFLLYGAYREGKRKREARARRDAQRRADMAAQELRAIARLAPPSLNVPAVRTLQQEEIYRYAYMILQAYQQREDLPTNILAAPKSPGLTLSELLYEVAERDRPASKA